MLQEYVRTGHGLIATIANNTHRVFPQATKLRRYSCNRQSYFHAIVKRSHPVLTSVRRVQLPGDGQQRNINYYIAHVDRIEGIPLLRKATNDKKGYGVIAFNHGAGRFLIFAQHILRLPIIQNKGYLKDYDNHRFAINVDQWLSGYVVPGSIMKTIHGAASSLHTQTRDTVLMKNGDVISGKLVNENFTIKTSYASISIKTNDISRIVIEGGGANLDMVTLLTGDRLSGMLENEQIVVRLPAGAEITMERDKIKEINIVPKSN